MTIKSTVTPSIQNSFGYCFITIAAFAWGIYSLSWYFTLPLWIVGSFLSTFPHHPKSMKWWVGVSLGYIGTPLAAVITYYFLNQKA